MVALHPYPRGFVIFRRDSSPTLPEGWPTVSLGDSEWNFAHDHLEAPELVTIGDGDRWVLVHGLCLYAGDDERDMTPAHRLAEAAATDESSFLDLLDVLGGRHVVLLGTAHGYSLYQDATGMRSVYFSPAAQLVGSHVNLLTRIRSHSPRSDAEGRRGCLRAWDRTPFLGIRALLPNHRLKVPMFGVDRFFPRCNNPYRQWSTADRVVKYVSMWERQWKEFLYLGLDPVLSVTGGHDSRTNLALLSNHTDEIRTFTYTTAKEVESNWADSVRLDEKIVRDIKKCINLDHRFFITRPSDRKNPSIPRELIAQNTVGNHGSWLLPYYLKHFKEDHVIHIRGNTYGVYKAPWGAGDAESGNTNLRNLYMTITKSDRGFETRESREQHFQEGAQEWQYNNGLYDYHGSEVLYWELRLGRWASEIYNETDIAFSSFDPTNVRRMLEVALSFTFEQKAAKFFQSEIINSTYPILNFPGKNQSENLYEQNRNNNGQIPDLTGKTPKPRNPSAIDTGKGLLALETGMTVVRDGEVVDWVPTDSSDLYMPTNHFVTRTVSARMFATTNSHGSLTFTVESDYAKHAARGTWFYQISVDGTVRARWDGALRNQPVHVTVSDMRPGSTVEVQTLALRDRRAIRSWESATRARIVNAVFTEHDSAAALSVGIDVPGAILESSPEKLTVSVDGLNQLTTSDFKPEMPQRIDVITSHCVIPLLVIRRASARRTVILCNGPVDLNRTSGLPEFQRSGWWPEIAHHQIYVCDPATVGQDAVSIAWGQYSPEYWSVPDTARAISAISHLLGHPDGAQRTYFGSSAGGFTALGLAALDTEAHAVINNAQFDWTNWYPTAVDATRRNRLRSISLSELHHRHRERVDILHWIATLQTPPRVDYWVNTAIQHDGDVSLPHFERTIAEYPHLSERMTSWRYHDKNAGSAPLGKPETIDLLNNPRI